MSLESAGPLYLIGAGKMGLALVRGWLDAGFAGADLTLVDPKPRAAAEEIAAQAGGRLVSACPITPPRVLVLAVKPQAIGPVMEALKANVGPETLVVSIAAGISLKDLAAGIGTDRVVRVMPNTPSQVGAGMSGLVAGPGADGADRSVAEALLRASGEVVWLENESDIDALTGVSGSGPAYVFYVVEALAAAGVAEGLDEEMAMRLARQTVIGAGALMAADPTAAGVLRENVTSPGGTTAAALEVLMAEDGLAPLMARAVKAARQRSEALGKRDEDL